MPMYLSSSHRIGRDTYFHHHAGGSDNEMTRNLAKSQTELLRDDRFGRTRGICRGVEIIKSCVR